MSDVSLDPASASSAVDLSIAKALRADDAFKATGAVVVLGTPSADQAMPYVVVGEGQTVPDPADSYDGSICYPTLHVWSRKTDFKECKAIAGAIRRLLHEGELDVSPDFRVTQILLEHELYLRDPDGQSKHVPMTFAIQVEPA